MPVRERARVVQPDQEPEACAPPEQAEPNLSFEQAITELAAVVQKLEQGDLPLEQSLELFERGVRLSRAAQARLDQAERRVEELLGFDTQGEPILRELDRG